MHIQNFIKIHPFGLKILMKNTFLHQSRVITLLLINEFNPFAIPNHSSLISMFMQSLKKIGQKLLKLELDSGNEALMDGWIDRRTDGRSKGSGGWLGRAMVLSSFQCRGVLLLWRMVEQRYAVLAAGGGQVSCFFFLVYSIFLF